MTDAGLNTPVDPFFTLDGETEWNAFIGRQSDEDAYADGYIEAARVLCSTLVQGRMIGSRDTLVMPILYNARHGVELALKLALTRLQRMGLGFGAAKQDHDIVALWSQLNEIQFGDAATSEIVFNLGPYVTSLGQLDADGQDFRYATRKDGERSMAELGLINLKRVRDSLTSLSELLDFLRFRVLELGHERDTGTFTRECSRRDLFEIARSLPPRADWGAATFDNVRSNVRTRFGLSANALARALDKIQQNPEMGAMIGIEFSLAHLSDDKVMKLLEAWGSLFPARPSAEGPLMSRIVPPMSREDRLSMARQHAAIDADILAMINDDELADLETMFYIGRDEQYGERYAGRLATVKREHAANGNRHHELHHLTSKGNLAQMLAAGSMRLGRPMLARRIEAWRPDLFSLH